MSEEHTVSFSLELNTEMTYSELRKLETVLYRTLGFMQKMGLPPEVDGAIQAIQRLIMNIRLLQITIHAFEMATGPIGWAYFGITAATAAFNFGEMFSDGLKGR